EAAQRLYEFESTPEQEAERPEVVAYRTIGRHTKHQHPHYALNYYKQNAEDQAAHWRERGCEVSEDELMTVSQHERIVGALRAENAQLRQHKNDYMDAGHETYRALQNEIREREAEIARLDGLVSGRTAERDAALAEVERLRQFERICEGLPQDAIDGGWTVQGIRGYAKRLEDQLKAALARVADMKTMADNYCALLMDANAKLAEMERQEPVALANRGLHAFWVKWTEAAAGLYGPGIKLYAAPVAQAQHSVPDGVTVNPEALRQVVRALVGPAHHIRELQVTASLPGSPITELVKQYNAWAAGAPGKEGA
ncbi:hypothetical protein QYP08_22495, partial [Pseudomonas aeruginosa]|nr:hypothetical protein [Pseudomonas aeruginosa]